MIIRILLTAIFLFIAIDITPAQTSVCGQGVFLKNDGAVIIDGWKLFPNFNPPNSPGIPNTSDWKDAPIRVTFGISVTDSTPICWETKEGSKCTTMKTIRGLAK